MINIEPAVFAAVKAAVAPVKCAPQYQNESKVFPLVTVEEIDNYVYERSMDSANIENHARVMYEVNVYSNLAGGKKAEAKEIMGTVDAVMEGLGFVRSFCQQTPNLSDATIYRLTARYKAVVSRENEISRR